MNGRESLSHFGIVFFSGTEWSSRNRWQRPHHLATHLSRFGNVLYIDPLGLRRLVFRDWKRVLKRISNRLDRSRTLESNGNLKIHSPLLYFPLPGREWADRFNGDFLACFIRRWMAREGIPDPIFWVDVPSPACLKASLRLGTSRLVYDVIDDFTYFQGNTQPIVKADRGLTEKAKIVFASSRELLLRQKEIHPEAMLLPNAAEFEHFYKTRSLSNRQAEKGNREELVLGYFGEISWWLDFDALAEAAERNPRWKIVMIGRIQSELPQRILKLKNIVFSGPRDYGDLPALTAEFDVCILPFKINALTRTVNPVKIYEYLATGKPVVSTAIPEVLPLSPEVRIAEPGRFAEAVRLACAETDEAYVNARLRIARANTWDTRVETIMAEFVKKGWF